MIYTDLQSENSSLGDRKHELITYYHTPNVIASARVATLYIRQAFICWESEADLEGLLSWLFVRHFFITAMLYVYGRFLSKQLVKTINTDQMMSHLFKYGLIKYHMIICYSLYIAGNHADVLYSSHPLFSQTCVCIFFNVTKIFSWKWKCSCLYWRTSQNNHIRVWVCVLQSK